ncbi:hypothetical protein A6R68_03686, partial [Neotoma lepida]
SDCQGERNITEALERMLCDSHQNQTLTEDLASENKCTLDPCTVLTARRKTCAQKCQVDQVLTQTQKESIVSADRKTNVKTGLDKADCPCELNIKDTLEKNLCAHHQLGTAFEDLTNANLHKLDLSTLLTSLKKCCGYMNQGDPANFSNMAHKLHRNRDQQQNFNILKMATRGNKESVLNQTQKGSTTSADRKANIKAVLKKIDCQGEEDIIEALEKMLCASHQDETSFEPG